MSSRPCSQLFDAYFTSARMREVFSDHGRVQGMLDFEAALSRAEARDALVARHVQPQSPAFHVTADKITDRRIHQASSSSSALAAATMMAHSMRLQKSRQPYSYTPVTRPVAW